MDVTVRYNRDSHTIKLTEDATVGQLKEELVKLVNIPVENQKIISRGKPLADASKKLSECGVVNGSKLMLLASTQPQIKEVKPSAASSSQSPPRPDQKILEQGPPEGAMKSFAAAVYVFPKEPFIVRTSNGIAKLQFETNALFVQYADENKSFTDPKSERIFASDIRAYSYEQSPNDKNGYFHLCLRLNDGDRIFYFLPNQYRLIISKEIDYLKKIY